jgi:ABC-type sulfate transport system substrate-binding protein
MENQVREKGEKRKKSLVAISFDVPRDVHKKILSYKNKITGLKDRDFTVKQAYVEFLKEMTLKNE